ncbi:MAG: hypothetical protein U5K76_03225 [Woeseiaceae bacterium]|nr:hypothetical protein [Woeseiaceae bacterium]
MLFPVFLATLFFELLSLNPQVLYAPSDFQNEENFLDRLHSKSNLEASFDRLNRDLESATEKLVETVSNRFGREARQNARGIRQAIQQQIEELKSSVKQTEESANAVSLQALPASDLQQNLLMYLLKRGICDSRLHCE